MSKDARKLLRGCKYVPTRLPLFCASVYSSRVEATRCSLFRPGLLTAVSKVQLLSGKSTSTVNVLHVQILHPISARHNKPSNGCCVRNTAYVAWLGPPSAGTEGRLGREGPTGARTLLNGRMTLSYVNTDTGI